VAAARARRERPPELALVMGAIAELLLTDDDSAQEPVRGVLLGEGDAAEDLHRAVGDLAGRAGDVRLRHRGRPPGLVEVVVEGGGRIEDGRPHARLAHVHVGQNVAQGLVAADGPAELPALARVGARILQESAGRPDGLGGGQQPARERQPPEQLGGHRTLCDARRGHVDVGELHRTHRHRRVECRLRGEGNAGCISRQEDEPGRAADGRDDGESIDRFGVLDRHLAAAQAARLKGRLRTGDRPPPPRLQQGDGHGVVPGDELRVCLGKPIGQRLGGEPQGGAAVVRRTRERGAQRTRHQTQLDGAEPLVAIHAESAERDERLPQRLGVAHRGLPRLGTR
jgi:hypothetical protein